MWMVPGVSKCAVPDHHIGYINAARKNNKELFVTFLLKSEPERVYYGRVQHVAM